MTTIRRLFSLNLRSDVRLSGRARTDVIHCNRHTSYAEGFALSLRTFYNQYIAMMISVNSPSKLEWLSLHPA